MTDVNCFMQSLKLTWITRLFRSTSSSWIDIFEQTICPISKLAKLGPTWCEQLSISISNKFWKEVLKTWTNFCDRIPIKSDLDVFSSPIWYNSDISKGTLFLPNWFKKGVECVGDVVGDDGNFLDEKSLDQVYGIKKKRNFLDTHRIKILTTKYISAQNVQSSVMLQRPLIPKHILFVLSNKNKAKGFYDVLMDNSKDLLANLTEKWNRELYCQLDEKLWSKIFTTCFKVIYDNDIIWFQFRIIHRILATQELLYKMSIKAEQKCLLCNEVPETLIHLFCQCPNVKSLWKDLTNWVYQSTNTKLDLATTEILLGYLKSDYYIPINVLILGTKRYIYSASRNNYNIEFSSLKAKLKLLYSEQYSIAKLNLKEEYYKQCWSSFSLLFL